MIHVIDTSGLPSVTAPVNFTANTGATPVALVSKPGEGEDARLETVFESHDIEIYDARPIADQLDMDRYGFELQSVETSVTDFYDDEEVKRVYYPEMEKLVMEATGADKVLVFDHTPRAEDPAIQKKFKIRPPVKNMHNDFTHNSVAARVRDLLPAGEAEARLKKRYGSVNVWRPIKGPVQSKHLVICEYGAIADSDLIAAERRYGDRIGGVYNLAYNPDQRWYYIPGMEREEVVLLKCYDSLSDGTARWTCHGSFDDPNAGDGASLRESIEIRTLMFWD
ncbi:MAG: CmcJ/NvfI family oxidoreductase [Alphaproteobacteria bacterium]|nr:CmcJ/NvfI family oxidoreductase [Alphaproteobacteria bacterium]MCZ6764615.1 CmcJ/NvfI family oxidoreductase [Alphaproteobacteria bacterium]